MLAVIMKTTKQSEGLKGHQIKAWLMAGTLVLCAPVASRAINAVTPATGAVDQGVAAPQTAPAARCSPGVADIVKMVDAKVDAEVIKTYIKNSPTAYNPSANEIIALKDRGVGPEILTAMLQRGAEVRVQSMQAAQAAASASAPQTYPSGVNPNAAVPGYDYGTQPAYPNYAYSYPANSYVYPSDAYAYPAYGYGYSWPYFNCGWGYGGYTYPYYCGGLGLGFCWGGRGYYGGGHYGHGYYGSHAYYGGHGSFAYGARSGAFVGSRGGFHSFGGGGRSASFVSHGGGFRSGGSFGGHSVSFAGHSGGFGGHGSGRGR
jgi:hypothetical protein